MTTTDNRPADLVPDGAPAASVDEKQARQVAEAAREAEWRKPSFGKELFLGRLRMDLIDPLPQPDPERAARAEEFLGKLREFAATRIDGLQIERDARIPDDVLRGLAELGAFGMKIDPEYGGLGLSNLHYCKALALVGSACPAIGALLSAHQSIGVPQPLKLFGTAEQKKKFLPRLAAGEVSAFLLTEPDVGSDPARMSSSATPVEGGYRLNGVKLWATNGTLSTLLVVMAQVPDAGITAFVVEADSPGVTVERRNAFMGLRGLENSVTRFHDVFVPAENVIGKPGRGLKIALATLNTGRLSLPAMCVSAGKWSLAVARQWAAERVQWGLPVARHEAVAQKIAFIAATTYGMEAMLDLCCLLADDDRNDIRIEAALVKLYASEMSWLMADELVQIRGGRGYETAESLAARGERAIGAEQILRDLRINRIFEGSTEIMHLFIAREAVDAHLSVAGDIIDPDAKFGPQGPRGRQGRRVLRPLAAHADRRQGPGPRRVRRVRPAGQARPVRRARLAQAGPRDVLRDGPLAGEAGAQAGLPRARRGHRGGAVRDVGGVRTGPGGGRAGRPGAGRPVLPAGPAPGGEAVRGAVGQHRRARRQRRPPGGRRAVRVPGGGRTGPGRPGGVGLLMGTRTVHRGGCAPPALTT